VIIWIKLIGIYTSFHLPLITEIHDKIPPSNLNIDGIFVVFAVERRHIRVDI